MKTISPAHLHQLLNSHAGLTLIDVRTPVEYAEVHVPQSRNVPLDQLDPKTLIATDPLFKNQPVYLLCRSGDRASKAAEQFAKENLDNTVVVEGGTLAWINADLPVERSTAKFISLERQVCIVAGSIVLTGVLLACFVYPYFIGLSAFVEAGLVFAGITDWCGMGLLLAKLPWNSRKMT